MVLFRRAKGNLPDGLEGAFSETAIGPGQRGYEISLGLNLDAIHSKNIKHERRPNSLGSMNLRNSSAVLSRFGCCSRDIFWMEVPN